MSLIPSPLADRHAAADARMGAFAGWEMPITYAGTGTEATAVREAVGIFDVSHLGTVWVSGPGAAATIDGSFTNDPRGLVDGRSQYTLCATEDGGVLDDLIVYRITEDRWMVVPNASNTAAVVERLRAVATDDVLVEDVSRDFAILAVQGPSSFGLVQRALAVEPDRLAFTEHTTAIVDGHDIVVCRTGYTGERGVELVAPAAVAGALWDRFVEAGAEPCGLAARDALRLEMGYPLHGHELSPDRSPYEARSGWAVKLDGRSFVGRDALAAAKQAGPARRTWGLVGDGRRPLRDDLEVSLDGTVVGTVTSGGFSPTLGVGIGMALLDASVPEGAQVDVDVRGKAVPFTVTRPPMLDRSPH